MVHATARLLAKIGPATIVELSAPTTSLGTWYAAILRWRSPGALFVNEFTLPAGPPAPGSGPDPV